MNFKVLVLDNRMKESSQMLDDSSLNSQIMGVCNLLHNSKMSDEDKSELYSYLCFLICEYSNRFNVDHLMFHWAVGFATEEAAHNDFSLIHSHNFNNIHKYFLDSDKCDMLINDYIIECRKYIVNNIENPTWTNAVKPGWWELYKYVPYEKINKRIVFLVTKEVSCWGIITKKDNEGICITTSVFCGERFPKETYGINWFIYNYENPYKECIE